MQIEKNAEYDPMVEQIIDRLRTCSLFLYAEHRDVLGNVLSAQNYALQKARRHLQRERIFFAPLTGESAGTGLRRLDDEGMTDGMQRRRLKSFRAIKRAQNIGSAVNTSRLGATDQHKHWATMSVLSATKTMLHGNAVRAQTRRIANKTIAEETRRALARQLLPAGEPQKV